MTRPVCTTCPYCGVGCGVVARVTGERTVDIAGDRDHPANRGRLCSKGTHLGETVGLNGRLLHPMIGDRRAAWDEALDLVADRFATAVAEHGPDSVGFYVSGQLLTEDYYVANKLMKGFIGSANIDTNSRLCMSSAVSAHLRAFGEDVVPACYEDLEAADLIVLVGSNTAWCHPVVWQRIEAARSRSGVKLVVIDPRRTETAEMADLHLPLRAGTDVRLFNSLLAALRARGQVDEAYIAAHVLTPEGFWEGIAEDADPGAAAAACGLDPVVLDAFFDLAARHPRTVTLFSQGVNQSTQGADKANAIINFHLATGRIGKPGAAPFSITGQPNAMGGREVGGLASTLAAHMDFAEDNRDRVGRFWGAPALAAAPGLKAVDLFRAAGDGRLKALWIMATNPAVSMPDAGAVRDALAACPFVVVSDVMADTDTGRLAHVRFPAAAWGEKDGTVTNSERMISRQRPFFPPPGEARPDWRTLADVGRRMGHGSGFAWTTPAEVFDEHCRLTAFENDGRRRLDLSPLIGLEAAAYDRMTPVRWGADRVFADGSFSTPDGRARLVAVRQQPLVNHDLILNTGRYRDQWHTMSRTGLSPRLSQHRREPLVELHPDDAARFGLADGDLAVVRTAQGESVFRLAITDAQRPGEAFAPIHWTDRTASGGRTGRLADPAADPVSGQPGFKRTAMTVTRLHTDWRAFLILRGETGVQPDCVWWAAVTAPGGRLFELAGDGDPHALEALLPDGERMTAVDPARGTLRIGVLKDGRLQGALFVARDGRLPARDWLLAQLSETVETAGLLAGRAPGAAVDRGPVVCACFDVRARTILTAIAEQGLTSVAEVGAALSAGSNCGSCRPAIARLLAA